MLDNPDYALTDPAQIRELVETVGWATLVTATGRGEAVVSHLPIVVEDGEPLSIVSHLGRPDDVAHELGAVDVTLVVQGPGGYVSPSWYEEPGYIPTWNYLVCHLTGRPVLLDAEETYDVLLRTVDRFERQRPAPYELPEGSRDVATGTAGFRLVPDRVVAKAKLSQDKSRTIAERVTAALESDPVHASPELASYMRRRLGSRADASAPAGAARPGG